jgi:hypothetical protein
MPKLPLILIATALAILAASCGGNSEEIRAVASAARAGEHTSYDFKALETESAAASSRLPAVLEAHQQQREEYLNKVADVGAEVACNELAAMLDTGSFPSESQWEQDLTSGILNAGLKVPRVLHAWTEATVGATYNYLAGGDGVIDASEVEDAQSRLC